MKTYLLLLLAFAMKMTSWAQDNMLPTVVDGRSWNVVSIHPAEPPESDSIPPGYYQDIKGRWGIGFPHTYMLRGDTIMNDVAYKKLYMTGLSVVCAKRMVVYTNVIGKMCQSN